MVLRVKPIFGKSASWLYDGLRIERYVPVQQLSSTGPQAWHHQKPGSQKTYCRDRSRHEGCRARKRLPTLGFHLRCST
jgi:hypothetical protein